MGEIKGRASMTAILWRRLDHPGHEWCSLLQDRKEKTISGLALFQYGQSPCRMEYVIRCDPAWKTRAVRIDGFIGKRLVSIELTVDSKGLWRRNGRVVSSVDGCIDVDLGFSPSTNLLPIRRIGLRPGRKAEVTAAWVEFPSLRLKPLPQVYGRIDEQTMHYESSGGVFKRDLLINRHGFVTHYPDYWEVEEPT
jgi:hypothetical protein